MGGPIPADSRGLVAMIERLMVERDAMAARAELAESNVEDLRAERRRLLHELARLRAELAQAQERRRAEQAGRLAAWYGRHVTASAATDTPCAGVDDPPPGLSEEQVDAWRDGYGEAERLKSALLSWWGERGAPVKPRHEPPEGAVRVAVPGPLAEAHILPEQLASYLRRTRWREATQPGSVWNVWERDSEEYLHVPAARGYRDFAREMGRAVENLGVIDGRAGHEVLRDIAAEVVGG